MADIIADLPASARRYNIPKGQELRIAADLQQPAYIMLLSGSAELFGVELAPKRKYTIKPGRSIAIFTWYAAEVAVWGKTQRGNTVTKNNFMKDVLQIHGLIQKKRRESLENGLPAPRVMIVGPTDVGKSTLSKILCAYAARTNFAPAFIDLDLGQNEVSIPGTLSTAVIHRKTLSIENNFDNINPLVFFFGHTTPSDLHMLYSNMVQRLENTLDRYRQKTLENDDAGSKYLRSSGFIVNTMGWVRDGGYEIIKSSIQNLRIDTVLCVGDDALHEMLKEDLPNLSFKDSKGAGDIGKPELNIELIKVYRNDGVAIRDKIRRTNYRNDRFYEYFYGPRFVPNAPSLLSPDLVTLSFSDVVLLRVGGNVTDSGLVPIGRSSALNPMRVSVVSPSASLRNLILGVSFATEMNQVPHVNVAGFLHVREVDLEKNTFKVLSPHGPKLPGKFLIVGTVSWNELQ